MRDTKRQNRRLSERDHVSKYRDSFDEERFNVEDDFMHDVFKALVPVVMKYKRRLDGDPISVLERQIDSIIWYLEDEIN